MTICIGIAHIFHITKDTRYMDVTSYAFLLIQAIAVHTMAKKLHKCKAKLSVPCRYLPKQMMWG